MADFSKNIVNQRFRQVYFELENRNFIKGKSDIAKRLGTYNHVINSILKGQRNITVDQLNKLFELFGLNANYLFGISNDMFVEGAGSEHLLTTFSKKSLNFSGRQNITMVPEKAIAGYALNHQENNYMANFPTFSIPGQEGDLLAFEISGDSMMPTITNGDIVICEPVERTDPMRDNQVYVIVTDVVVAKRIQQVKGQHGVTQLRLISDNHSVYQAYEVDMEEVRQILKVKCRLTNYAIN